MSDTPPLSPDTETAGKLSEIIASAVEPSLAQWLEYCNKDVKRTSGTAFVFVGLVECGSTKARDMVFEGIKKFDPDVLKKAIESQLKSDVGMMSDKDTGSKMTAGKRKRDNDSLGDTKSQSLTGLQVLLYRFNQRVSA